MTSKWYVYILQVRDGSFYTGITNDLVKRFATHEAGLGSKYVKSRRPFRVVYVEEADGRSSASKRELEIKKYASTTKLGLCIGSDNKLQNIIKEQNIPKVYWEYNKEILGVKI